jgi:hypothetical protein
MDYALTTNTRVKQRIEVTTTSFDSFIDSLIYSTTARIEQMTGRRFKRGIYTNELYDGVDEYGDRKPSLVLKNAPVTALTSLQYKSGNNENPVWFDYTENDYDVNEITGVLYMNGLLASGRRNIRVSYTAGYLIDFATYGTEATHNLPYDITEVCERVVVRIFKKRQSEGRDSESFGESSIDWSEGYFSAEDLTTINNYRRVEFI